MTRHFVFFWTPLDTIRDYYGDDIGLYTAWLVLYTKSLLWPAALGIIIQVYQSSQGDVSVDNNPLMVYYSVFLCLWSAGFNVAWQRRQRELAFLWGSEDVEDEAPVRTEFKGMLVMDEVTKEEEMTYTTQWVRAVRLVMSTLTSPWLLW